MSDTKAPKGPPNRGAPPTITDIVRRSPRLQEKLHAQQVNLSLHVPKPAPTSLDELNKRSDPLEPMQMLVYIEQVHEYDHNPRRSAPNEAFQQIKDSVRSQGGFNNPLTITRRPGDAHYIPEAGGNSRLRAIRELWEETGDERFHQFMVIFRPWKSESTVITNHLIENTSRGKMCLWDTAQGVALLRKQIEQETGKPLSLRNLEEELAKRGLTFSKSNLGRLQFVAEWLSPLNSGYARISVESSMELQKHINALRPLFDATGDSEAGYRDKVIDPVLRAFQTVETDSTFPVESLVSQWRHKAADVLAVPVSALESLLELAREHPNATFATLRTLLENNTPNPQHTNEREADATPARQAAETGASDAGAKAPQRDATSVDSTESSEGALPSPAQHLAPAALNGQTPFGADDASAHDAASGAPQGHSATGSKAPTANTLQPQLFIEDLGLEDAWRDFSDLPYGFYLEPIQLDTDTGRSVAWWALAYVSGQFDYDFDHALPDDSQWRQIASVVANLEQLEDAVQTVVGSIPHPARMAMFYAGTDTAMDDEPYAAFQAFLAGMRQRAEAGILAENSCPFDLRWLQEGDQA